MSSFISSAMERELYVDCITKQLEEVDMLSSIYCSPGEMHIFDPGVISDFNEFVKTTDSNPKTALKAHLDYIITITVLHGTRQEKLDVRIELPHLYPALENAIVSIHSTLLSKAKENYFKNEIEQFISTMERNETYIYQIISWIQDQIENLLKRDASEFADNVTIESSTAPVEVTFDFERLWIYSHHLKSKTKRQEIVRYSRDLDLTGFSRPGKPGIICVEGLQANTQNFWKTIKSMHWQKIFICKNELKKGTLDKLNRFRRFEGFKEQLFCDDLENEDGVMNMGLFLKYLELHNSGYMKKELFGLD